jgi:DNA-binding transcriptional MerR regulator/ubiquinone/menaquinone biosynthesis C-methylase UbiE
MRIGKFAAENQLSVDTIRHYIDLGLIVPEKKGGQYVFDMRCQDDLSFVLELKGMGFSLQEIKTVLLYRNIGHLEDYEENAYYQSIFIEKHQKLENEIAVLTEMKTKLGEKLEELAAKPSLESIASGLDIKVLDLLKCLKCGGGLSLEDARIQWNQIIEGSLTCGCGERYTIDSGILIVGKPHESISDHLFAENVGKYIQATDSGYLDNLHKGLQQGSRKIAELDLHQKVLLELGTGAGYLLRSIFQQLPEDCLYIAVDYNLKKHQFLKSLLERTGMKRNVLFICADFMQIPLRENIVDLLLDIAGTSNYSFEHEEFLLGEVNSLLKPSGHLLASFIVFNKFSPKSKITLKLRNNFTESKIRENILKLGYTVMEEMKTPPVQKGGQFEDFFVEGEEVYTFAFFGKRLG